jgi:hypothetical protein
VDREQQLYFQDNLTKSGGPGTRLNLETGFLEPSPHGAA